MFFRFNAYPFLWAACMLALNLGRDEGLPTLQVFYFLYFDKLAHFLQFFILTFLLIIGFNKQHAFISLRFNGMRTALVSCIIYAFVLEVIHFFRSPKYFEIWDLFADIFGCIAGALAFYLIYKIEWKNF